MKRELAVTVDASTWPETYPNFPTAFHSGTRRFDFNIPEILLWIGYLTTPMQVFGSSLSEYWAYVRYLCAISDNDDLRLTQSFFDLDPHQKTILSDDFGMGVPIQWLWKRLGFEFICDGRYFIERLAPEIDASVGEPSKRGPRKSPDFVARDQQGLWHVIECKGTQSGIAYRNRQLGRPTSPTYGAVSQKRTVTFPPNIAGQRLACGLFIAFDGGEFESNLRIIDPTDEESFPVGEAHEPLAKDAMYRAAGGRCLHLAGFRAASSALVAPSGIRPSSRPTDGRDEELRRDIVSKKLADANAELENVAEFESFQREDNTYYGRSNRIELPISIDVEGNALRHVFVRQGVHSSFLNELARQPVVDELHTDSSLEWSSLLGKTESIFEGEYAELRLGDLFFSEIELRH